MTNFFHDRVVTVAGKSRELGEPFGIAINGKDIFVSDGDGGRILKIGPDGAVITFASGLDTPSGITFAADGTLLVADTGSHSIKSVDSAGAIQTVAGIPGQPGDADGSTATALFRGPVGVAVGSEGRIFVSDTYNDRIRIIENGIIRTIAGSAKGFADGSGVDAKFDTPLGIAAWKDRVLVADSGNSRIRVVEPDGQVWTLAGNGSPETIDGIPSEAGFVKPTALTVTSDGLIYIADDNSIRVIGRRQFPFVETLSETRRGLNDGYAIAARFNRPSGVALDGNGEVFVADSDNQLVRRFTNDDTGRGITTEEIAKLRYSAAEFRTHQPGRWPYDPPYRTREIAGTLGEIRGEIVGAESRVWFHNGLDIVGSYGETARFIRNEKVLDPSAVENFETLRELIRMPTIGYIHIRIGRDSSNRSLGDLRFLFQGTPENITGVRVPRGTRFQAGEVIGTLNALNHVHLIAGRPGAEMNALDALILPGISDRIAPVIENVSFFDENWRPIETGTSGNRIILSGKARIVVRAYDRTDGNAERRRLAPYKVGWSIVGSGNTGSEEDWNISFEKMPVPEAVKFAYAIGSKSGATGETLFDFIATNTVKGYEFQDGFLDTTSLSAGPQTVRVLVVDFFGNLASKDIPIEVVK